MINFPASVSQYVELGQLLAACLEIPVLQLNAKDSKDFGPGWAYSSSHCFGVTNGNFATAQCAYADLAARCLDSCSLHMDRYGKFVTDEGREIILSALQALAFIEEVKNQQEAPHPALHLTALEKAHGAMRSNS